MSSKVSSSPAQLTVSVNGQTIPLTKKEVKVAGLSEKSIFVDPEQQQWMVKSAKARTIRQIFGSCYTKTFLDRFSDIHIGADREKALRSSLNEFYNTAKIGEVEGDQIIEKLGQIIEEVFKGIDDSHPAKQQLMKEILEENIKLVEHVGDTLANFMFTEILGPKIARALWGERVVVPETSYVNDKLDRLHPQIISKWLPHRLDEFVETNLVSYIDRSRSLHDSPEGSFGAASSKRTSSMPPLPTGPEFWEDETIARPTLKDLHFTEDQKKHLGRLYAIALVTGHYDVLNNITCTNSGSMSGRVACVDWGNTFGIGFSGLTKAENADMARSEERSQKGKVTSLEHSFPYTTVVSPDLPRMLVFDIFDLNDPNIAAGFAEFIDIASENSDNVDPVTSSVLATAPVSVRSTLNTTYGEIGEITKARIAHLKRVKDSCGSDLSLFKDALRAEREQYKSLV